MLFFAFILLIVCICIIVVAIFVRYNHYAKGTYERIKRKIFWNWFIRYILQSTLSNQLAAGAVIAITMGLKEQKQEETKDDEENEYKIKAKIAASAAILVFYNICPFVFICILVRNKKQLDSDECRGRYGSMY